MKKALIDKLIPNSVMAAFLKSDVVPDINTEFVIRSVDIGYGFVKYTKGIDKEGNIICDSFPSIAALSPQEEMGGSFFVKRNTKVIDSGGIHWEVGPDVGDIKTTNDVRALHENFIHTEQWKVFLLGALAYMEEPVIDYLVLGLPVSDMPKADMVVELAQKTHMVNGSEVQVKKVLVIPQPLGSLYNFAIQKQDMFSRFMNSNTLVADPGYLTFDFLTTKGFSVNAHRSGARPGGMSSILNGIASSISKEEKTEFDDLEQIDAALKIHLPKQEGEERHVSLYGKEIELTPHIKNTVPIIESSMNYLLQKIGTSKDINQIVMGGGSSGIFVKSIKRQFPKHQVIVLDDGIFANSVGFLLWGIMTAYGLEIQNTLNKKAS